MPTQVSRPGVSPSPSAPNLVLRDHNAHDNTETASTSRRKADATQLPRAASYTYFPKVDDLVFDDNKVLELKGTISEEDLAASSITTGDGDSSSSSTGPDSDLAPQLEIRRPSLVARRSSKILTVSKLLGRQKTRDEPEPSSPRLSTDSLKNQSPVRPPSKLKRRSTILSTSRDISPSKSPSRSPERSRKEVDGKTKRADSQEGEKPRLSEEQRNRSWNFSGRRMPKMGRSREGDDKEQAPEEDMEDKPTSMRKRTLRKSITRPSSVFIRGSTQGEARSRSTDIPDVPQLPKSFSTDRLPTIPSSPSTDHLAVTEPIPSLPRQRSTDRLRVAQLKPEMPKKKDELWTVFRTLDGDYQKFQSKSIALKTNVVRTTLLPFLRNYIHHASNQKLRAEDLDRRTNILNKWWTGLLEMLAGRNSQSISGTDRPTILEAIIGIMERPEWRLRPSPFSPLSSNGFTTPTVLPSKSSTSLSSTSSDFLIDSVQHNVRNTFIQNLMSQMAFVVEKMSSRNAPASLVSFCGKTCAYAFFFCPGTADILVRLWAPSPDAMRRVLEENGISRLEKLERLSTILSYFPPTLHTLKVVSLRRICQELRKPYLAPVGAATNIDWHGPWVKRWSGVESDLFYVFAKHFHRLTNEFLPPEISPQEKICSPGLLMVHTQMLVNLDATIHRHTNLMAADESSHGPPTPTFDDYFNGDPDATAAPIPSVPANVIRPMAENRLVMLMRDMLSDRMQDISGARHMFAESFCQLMKACARKVSLYDHNASYTLCDFLEEAVMIIFRYEQTSKTDVLDWPFWLSVCKKMAESQNTATEIRLYSFLYAIWGTICTEPERKTDICLDFLLEETFFESRFNHWCPMVRSYYMRLLCWRVARFDDDEAYQGDIVIFDKLLGELRRVWSHYLYLKEGVERSESLPISTIPCPPAPGRRLLIIRTDAPPHSGTFLSFDGIIQSQSHTPPPSKKMAPIDLEPERPSSALSNASSDYGQGPIEDVGKKRWNMFKSFIGIPSSPRSKSRSPGPKDRTASPQASSGTSTPTAVSTTSETTAVATPPTHRAYCFRFSLEWGDKRFQIVNNMRIYSPRLPLPAQQFLQSSGKALPTVSSVKPEGDAIVSSTYAGRALAEWSMVVNECQNFFERRKNEGVPANKWVETPTLGVETFKKPG